MRLAEKIKDALTVSSVIEHYGFKLAHGKMPCPFHHEKQASFTVNRSNKSWKCYGCQSGGTVIDFVMKLYNIGFGQALLRLNNDFALGLTDERPSKAEITKIQAENLRKKKEEAAAHRLYMELCDKARETKTLIRALEKYGFEDNEAVAGWYFELRGESDYIDYLFSVYDELGEVEFWRHYRSSQKNNF